MSVRLIQPVPAFQVDDTILGGVWRAIETKWDGQRPSTSTLTVYERVRATGRRAAEEHQHKYRSIDELRRAPSGPAVLREYTLSVGSWGDSSREVYFRTPGRGSAASIEVNAADAEWCREVVDTILKMLQPHMLWYSAVHRVSLWVLLLAAVLALVSVTISASLGFPEWSVPAVALYLSLTVVVLWRERIFPAADVLVRRRGAQPTQPESGEAASAPGRARGEPTRQDRGGLVALSDHRQRSGRGDTTPR